MKIAIYSPYLDTFGGGEKYILTIGEILAKTERVDILLDINLSKLNLEEFKEKMKKYHDLDFDKLNFKRAPFGYKCNFLKRLFFLKAYDWFFYLTDGSFFLSTAKNSIIHFQVPFVRSKKSSMWEAIKALSWKKAIFNSKFTKEIIEKDWPFKGDVFYPPVDIDKFKVSKKRKYILSVGRFFGYTRFKKQDLLISEFKKISQELGDNWSLHLAGVATEGDVNFLQELKDLSRGTNVQFYPNIDLKDLIKLYSESSIYWHAAGFGETDPTKYEHFGITTVEAMASGCVPVVTNKGGQKEIVSDGIEGFLWDSLLDFEKKTLKIAQDNHLREEFSRKSIEKSKEFSKSNFEKLVQKLVYGE